jgi:hypothetical protein
MVGYAHHSPIMEVNLICPFCGTTGDNVIQHYSEFNIAGYTSPTVEWSDFQNEIPSENEYKWWSRTEKIPEVGERRVILVQHTFRETEEKDFWTFYQPAYTSVNGLDVCIEEIDTSAFVRCRLLKILAFENNQAWLQVLVNEVILIKDAQNTIPLVHEDSSFLKKVNDFSPYYYLPYGNWEYYFGGDQSYAGNWFMIYKNEIDVRLISFGEWICSEESAYLGNLVIADSTYHSLMINRKLA